VIAGGLQQDHGAAARPVKCFDPLRLFALFLSGFSLPSSLECAGERQMGFEKVRIQTYGLAEFADGAARVVQIEQNRAEFFPNLGVLG